ncbi:MAG: hypothetical protein Q4P07_11550 [Ornithinimicrobium sp.]|uniref:hypothetical protein n=1 Tax=Ornithinimicrobium sp. TaxID=1977084 RepID=UPI0026E027DC|nr:hypothetical protein [Ornithinimicrobium sp.]MDO5740769.1 hypothetical protein [Ornithinimicrobium sp.]
MTDPDERVGIELERVVRRWQQLPLDRALSALPHVSALVQTLADEVAAASEQVWSRPVGSGRAQVPDLGPGAVMDQLRVMVYDWQQADLPAGDLADRLTTLRRSLP